MVNTPATATTGARPPASPRVGGSTETFAALSIGVAATTAMAPAAPAKSNVKNVQEFICDFQDCGRRFLRKTSLTNHRKAHNNVKSRSINKGKRLKVKSNECPAPGVSRRRAPTSILPVTTAMPPPDPSASHPESLSVNISSLGMSVGGATSALIPPSHSQCPSPSPCWSEHAPMNGADSFGQAQAIMPHPNLCNTDVAYPANHIHATANAAAGTPTTVGPADDYLLANYCISTNQMHPVRPHDGEEGNYLFTHNSLSPVSESVGTSNAPDSFALDVSFGNDWSREDDMKAFFDINPVLTESAVASEVQPSLNSEVQSTFSSLGCSTLVQTQNYPSLNGVENTLAFPDERPVPRTSTAAEHVDDLALAEFQFSLFGSY